MAVSFGRENNRLWRNIIKLIRGGVCRFLLSPSAGLGGFIGAGLCRGCDALSVLWWPTSAGRGAKRSGLDTPLFERGWYSSRSSGLYAISFVISTCNMQRTAL